METVRLATRKSALALRQAEMAREWLQERLPDTGFELLPMSTSGDRKLAWSLEKQGGKGLFTKELEEALLHGEADLAVHSAKDLPTAMPDGLAIAGYLPRARAKDILIRREDAVIPGLIATSSPRRRAQIKQLYPQAAWTTIRGNVATRLAKVADGKADATILAAAGLDRLGISGHEGLVFEPLAIEDVVPPAGQAAIALQSRGADHQRFAPHLCAGTALAVTLERRFLGRLGGGCQTPIGTHFSEGRLYVFHPACGHREFEIKVATVDAIDDALDHVFGQLGPLEETDTDPE